MAHCYQDQAWNPLSSQLRHLLPQWSQGIKHPCRMEYFVYLFQQSIWSHPKVSFKIIWKYCPQINFLTDDHFLECLAPQTV